MNSQDFESLPPAVRRKFFSNVERLRFRLAQSDPCSTPNHPVNATSSPRARPIRRSSTLNRPLPRPRLSPSIPLKSSRFHHHHHRSSSRSRSRSHSRSPQKLRKPGSLQLAALVTQVDSQCFHSLPAKLQQKLFSPEERRRLCRVYRESLICDAADQAFYRGNRSSKSHSQDSLPSEATLPVAQPSTVFYDSDSDDSEWDSNSTMDQSIYDSFRWLDEDGDLDLSLDEYHSHVANAATGKAKLRRLPSFRRSLSFSTNTMMHRASPSMPTRAFPTSHTIQPLSPLPPLSPLSPITPITPRSNRRSTSRPPSRRLQSSHAAKSSTSSIDPSAQYYHDPDARLKLRVYLASPQKFDEAIEFGFPSLEQIQQNKENISPEPIPRPSRSCAGTFFEDDDGNVVGSPGDSIEEPMPSASAPGSGHGYAPTSTSTSAGTSASAPAAAPTQTQQQTFPRLSMRDTPRPSVDTHAHTHAHTPSLLQRRQSLLPKSTSKTPHRLPGNREMTLKMTLTRPDLREESPTPSATPDDPLRLAALPPADRSQMIWDDLDGEKGVVRKMWRKLRRR